MSGKLIALAIAGVSSPFAAAAASTWATDLEFRLRILSLVVGSTVGLISIATFVWNFIRKLRKPE